MSDVFAPDQPEFFMNDPHPVFRRLRREDPVHWYEGSGGNWCLLEHADIEAVSRNPRLFTSTRGIQIGLHTEEDMRFPGVPPTILEMDPPDHNRHRKLVIQAFTPAAAAKLEPVVRRIARNCFEAIEPGRIDLVDALAVPIPMFVIADMLGVSRDDHADFKRWSDSMVEAGGGYRSASTDAAMTEMFGYFHRVLEARRRDPQDDLISTLANASIDGDRLSDPEILIFCITLLAAGNETTRNLISGGSLLLLRNPDEKRKLIERPELLPQAIEEMLRWWTPVQSFTRAATEDTQLQGRQIRTGQHVLLLYASANRDEKVWGDDADRFDVTRDHTRRRHLSFGFGEHVCLGAALARLEAQVVFEELLARFPDFELDGEPVMLHSRLMHGIEHLPVVLG